MSVLKFFTFIFNKIANFFCDNCENTHIVFRSKHFVIIDKAYDLKINSNDKNELTVQTFMKKKLPSLASSELYHEYYFIHRLDYSTSGLMCIPIHKEACQVASKAIQERQCKKYYIALVRGYLSSNILDLNFPIGRDCSVNDFEKMCVTTQGNARDARTVLVVVEKGLFDNYPATKILLRPITGRRHQLRVHCSHIGHTIIGDYTYSNKKDIKPPRMYLHAFRLVIPNSVEDINVQSNDPFTAKKVRPWKVVDRCYSLIEGFDTIDSFVQLVN